MARLNFGIAAVALLLVAPTRAEWAVTGTQTDRGSAAGVEHRRIVLADSVSGAEARLNLAFFSTKSATLRVIDNPNSRDTLAATMQREQCVAGVNGGYFDPEGRPVGLLVSDGKLIASRSKARLLSGVVSVSQGRVQIQRAAEFSNKMKPTEARQCGPFLLDCGKPIAGLNPTRGARRTFVLTGAGEKAALGYCSHVTLAQLAEILGTPGIAGELKIKRALNLDGGSSSGFWFNGNDGVFSIREQKRVRDYLAVVPR